MLHVPSGVTPASLFVASMAAKPFSSTYLQAGIGGARNWDLSYLRILLRADQVYYCCSKSDVIRATIAATLLVL